MNKYDLNHVCTAHPQHVARGMGPRLRDGLAALLHHDHVETILRRVAVTKANASNALFLMTWFMGASISSTSTRSKAASCGCKARRDRRPGLPIEPVWSFYPKYFAEVAGKLARWAALYVKLRRIYLRIKSDPRALCL